jgi:hypothetical protein
MLQARCQLTGRTTAIYVAEFVPVSDAWWTPMVLA